MHTTSLRSDDFTFTLDGRAASLSDVLPGFDEHDRLGIVLTADGGGLDAGLLVLAAVTAFYDRMRALHREFFAYPDYFAFHVGRDRGTLRKLDIWPGHKEVVVAPEPEAILRAVNDRAVTRLLVPEAGARPAPATVSRETRASALRRLRTALVYRPADGADLIIRGSPASLVFLDAMRDSIGHDRTAQHNDGPQKFRRTGTAAALGLVAAPCG